MLQGAMVCAVVQLLESAGLGAQGCYSQEHWFNWTNTSLAKVWWLHFLPGSLTVSKLHNTAQTYLRCGKSLLQGQR